MTTTETAAETMPRPSWLDPALYPFRTHAFDTPDGRLSYVDEGDGPPVVLVHGTPTWSFLWRHAIARLAATHRVIAVDHLGFGLSDKPALAPYDPRDHARRLVALLDALDVRGATMVAHDFGGPIGLAATLERPGRIARLALLDTWLWSVDDDPTIARGARLAASGLGRLLYRHLNFPVRVLMPKVVADARVLTPAIRRHYEAPLATPDARMGAWGCARALAHAGAWFDELWARRDELLGRPMLLLWGMKDPTFGPAFLARWRATFPEAAVHEVASSGHFVQEEAPEEVAEVLARFVS